MNSGIVASLGKYNLKDKDEYWRQKILDDAKQMGWYTVGNAVHHGNGAPENVCSIMFYGSHIYSIQYFYEKEFPHLWCLVYDTVANNSELVTFNGSTVQEIIVALEDSIGSVLV